MAYFPCDAGVGVVQGGFGGCDVFSVVFEGVVESAVPFSSYGRVFEPDFGESDAFIRALVLES